MLFEALPFLHRAHSRSLVGRTPLLFVERALALLDLTSLLHGPLTLLVEPAKLGCAPLPLLFGFLHATFDERPDRFFALQTIAELSRLPIAACALLRLATTLVVEPADRRQIDALASRLDAMAAQEVIAGAGNPRTITGAMESP